MMDAGRDWAISFAVDRLSVSVWGGGGGLPRVFRRALSKERAEPSALAVPEKQIKLIY